MLKRATDWFRAGCGNHQVLAGKPGGRTAGATGRERSSGTGAGSCGQRIGCGQTCPLGPRARAVVAGVPAARCLPGAEPSGGALPFWCPSPVRRRAASWGARYRALPKTQCRAPAWPPAPRTGLCLWPGNLRRRPGPGEPAQRDHFKGGQVRNRRINGPSRHLGATGEGAVTTGSAGVGAGRAGSVGLLGSALALYRLVGSEPGCFTGWWDRPVLQVGGSEPGCFMGLVGSAPGSATGVVDRSLAALRAGGIGTWVGDGLVGSEPGCYGLAGIGTV